VDLLLLTEEALVGPSHLLEQLKRRIVHGLRRRGTSDLLRLSIVSACPVPTRPVPARHSPARLSPDSPIPDDRIPDDRIPTATGTARTNREVTRHIVAEARSGGRRHVLSVCRFGLVVHVRCEAVGPDDVRRMGGEPEKDPFRLR